MTPNASDLRLIVLSIEAYESIYQGVRVLVDAEPRLAEKPFIPQLSKPPSSATSGELWYRSEMGGLLHAFRLHGHMATHPATLRFDQANKHFARALMGTYSNVPKFIESSVSAFYEVFVFNSIARTGITCEFIPRINGKSPDIMLPKMRLLVECKDIQGRSLTTWSISNLGRRIRECHESAVKQLEGYPASSGFEHMVFIDLPDDNLPLRQAMSRSDFIELYSQILDAGGSMGLDIERADSLILSTSGIYHLVEASVGVRQPIVVPQIHPPAMFPRTPMKAMLLDAIFAGEGMRAWANWQPAMTARMQFEHLLPTDYLEAKASGQAKDYLATYW